MITIYLAWNYTSKVNKHLVQFGSTTKLCPSFDRPLQARVLIKKIYTYLSCLNRRTNEIPCKDKVSLLVKSSDKKKILKRKRNSISQKEFTLTTVDVCQEMIACPIYFQTVTQRKLGKSARALRDRHMPLSCDWIIPGRLTAQASGDEKQKGRL